MVTDPLSLEFIGAQLRAMQAEQRTTRASVEALTDRIGAIEARIDTRFDQMHSDLLRTLDARFEQTHSDMLHTFDARIDARFDHMQAEILQSLNNFFERMQSPP